MTHAKLPLGLAVLAIVLPLAVLPPSGPCAAGDDELVALARSRNRVVIAQFGLGLCRQCKAQSAILENIRETYRDKVVVRMVHVNEEQQLTARYQIETIPHLIFFGPSGSVALRKTGVMKYEDITAQLSRMGVAP